MSNRCDNCKVVRGTCKALQSTGCKPNAFEIERLEMVCAETMQMIDMGKSVFE